MEDYIEHHGTKGMRWGIRRYQNPDGSLTALGRSRLAKPKTSTEKWKYRQIKQIDKLYERSYKKLNKAYLEEPLDPSISKYKEQLISQHKKDLEGIESMTFVEVQAAREQDRIKKKAARDQMVKRAASASLWAAKMALLGVRIGGTVAVLNVLSDAGRTAYDFLSSNEGQRLIKAGTNIVTKFGNGELTALNLAKDFFRVKASGSIMDRALSDIDISGVMPGANYIPPSQMSAYVSDITTSMKDIEKYLK